MIRHIRTSYGFDVREVTSIQPTFGQTQPALAGGRLTLQEARHYGYSQIHIEFARKEFVDIAYTIDRLQVAPSFGNGTTQEHGTQPDEIRIIVTPHERFDTFAPQFFPKQQFQQRASQLWEKVRSQGATEGWGGDARIQARQTQVRKRA
jgi:hypothetical protein